AYVNVHFDPFVGVIGGEQRPGLRLVIDEKSLARRYRNLFVRLIVDYESHRQQSGPTGAKTQR
ncbi:MAG: hypothetical protein M3294_03225, partial [Pseudomonadota bacterium]|nr:hypothetical protein [Pseudomonadota bacterium]